MKFIEDEKLRYDIVMRMQLLFQSEDLRMEFLD